MAYLLSQMLLYLMGAALIGVLVGYLLQRFRMQQKMAQLDHAWSAKFFAIRRQMIAGRGDVGDLAHHEDHGPIAT